MEPFQGGEEVSSEYLRELCLHGIYCNFLRFSLLMVGSAHESWGRDEADGRAVRSPD